MKFLHHLDLYPIPPIVSEDISPITSTEVTRYITTSVIIAEILNSIPNGKIAGSATILESTTPSNVNPFQGLKLKDIQ